jgi:hypothetical protein
VVKGVRLFTCQPNHGVLVRPDKITVLAHKGQKTPQRPSASENLSSFSSSSSQHSSPFPKPGSRPSTPSSSESPAHFYNPDSKNSHGDPDVVIGSDPCIEDIMPRNRVGLAYDERMGAHKASCGYHPEQPARIKVRTSTRVEHTWRESMSNLGMRAAVENSRIILVSVVISHTWTHTETHLFIRQMGESFGVRAAVENSRIIFVSVVISHTQTHRLRHRHLFIRLVISIVAARRRKGAVGLLTRG